MLTISSAIVSYSLLYRNAEVQLLLTLPLRIERLVQYKFQETAAISGWGFLLLGTPMLIAYGIVAQAPWYYYLVLLPFLLSFVLIPSALGTILCLLVARYVPTLRIQVIGLAAAAACVAAGVWAWSVLGHPRHDLMTAYWFQDTLARVRYSEQQLLPSWWLGSGLLEASHPNSPSGGGESWRESLGFLAVLASNALLLQAAVGWLGERHFVNGYSAIAAQAGGRAGPGQHGWTALLCTRPSCFLGR